MSELPTTLSADSTPDTSTPTARIGSGTKACAAGAGVLGAVCCGGGVIAVSATLLGATGAAVFMRTWYDMQAVTLISSSLAVLAVAALAAWATRGMRAAAEPHDAHRAFGAALVTLGAWALVGYFVFYIVVSSVLTLSGFEYPKM